MLSENMFVPVLCEEKDGLGGLGGLNPSSPQSSDEGFQPAHLARLMVSVLGHLKNERHKNCISNDFSIASSEVLSSVITAFDLQQEYLEGQQREIDEQKAQIAALQEQIQTKADKPRNIPNHN